MEEEHYDIPWEYKKTRLHAARPHSSAGGIIVESPNSPTAANRGGGVFQVQNCEISAENRLSKTHASRQSLTARPAGLVPHNETVPGSQKSASLTKSSRDNFGSTSSSHRLRIRSSHASFDRDNLIHDANVDRATAENLLRNSECGCFLLRMRPEGNMALSLKSGQGVILHIKLEERENRWVLGDGPSFSSVRSVIRYYSHSSHTLPIRGAEHIQLRSPVLVNRFTV
ncbi:hypothetical protein L596_026347 [Steinernema carpocapsae]|uniref:SH2 domain-containing protein n=1 Tax=Steinernema carpocapsae TaxID=34508 RepID=A0A4U5M132_STECR|nr:hypothetical protein L596_026347 [Steinernema carpocapsae]